MTSQIIPAEDLASGWRYVDATHPASGVVAFERAWLYGPYGREIVLWTDVEPSSASYISEDDAFVVEVYDGGEVIGQVACQTTDEARTAIRRAIETLAATAPGSTAGGGVDD